MTSMAQDLTETSSRNRFLKLIGLLFSILLLAPALTSCTGGENPSQVQEEIEFIGRNPGTGPDGTGEGPGTDGGAVISGDTDARSPDAGFEPAPEDPGSDDPGAEPAGTLAEGRLGDISPSFNFRGKLTGGVTSLLTGSTDEELAQEQEEFFIIY